MSKIMWITALGLALGLVGCGNGDRSTSFSGSDGSKVSVDSNGKATVTDGKGTTVETQTGPDGKGMTATTTNGDTVSLGGSVVTEAELMLPYYPDSNALPNADIKLDSKGIKTYMSVRTTSDSAAKVIAFYKEKVQAPQTALMGESANLSGKLDGGWKVNVLAKAVDGVTQIQIGLSNDPKG